MLLAKAPRFAWRKPIRTQGHAAPGWLGDMQRQAGSGTCSATAAAAASNSLEKSGLMEGMCYFGFKVVFLRQLCLPSLEVWVVEAPAGLNVWLAIPVNCV